MESLDWFTTKSQGPLILAQFWQQRAVLAEKELSVLKEQFERAEDSSKRQRLSSDQANEAPPPPNMDTPLDVMGRPSLLELAAKEKEVQTLIEDVQKLQSTLNQLRESSARQLSNFEEELQVRGRHIQRLEAQLEAQKDYQEIRRELSILKSIEFPHLSSTVDDDDDDHEDIAKKSDKVPTSALAGGNKPLEVLLLERNKALQSENTALKVANSELQGEDEKTLTLPLEETSPPSPPPSSSSSASPGPAVLSSKDEAIVDQPVNNNNNKSNTTEDCEADHSTANNNNNDNNDTMPSSTRLGLNSPMAAAAAAAAAAAHVGPPPPFSPFVGAVSASGLMGPRHLPPVFHPVLGGLGSLGHFFNEDMLLHWRRSLEASMLSHHQQQQMQQQQERRMASPDRARASSPGSDNGGEENISSSLFGQRTPTTTGADGTSTTPTITTTPRCPTTPTGQQQQGLNSSTPNSSGVATLPGWPSWEDSHLARLQQEFITRGGVYPGFGGPGSVNSLTGGGLGNGSLDGGDGPSAAALASLMALPEGLTSLLAKSNPLEARLQEMLRATMERYASQALDTLAISRGVRELLSMHNIGQRLFAKFVLGLSQGTVSELLSKPKPWDKLTEKGRDSYRKMHAWACDEAAILLLKSLIPRKGKETGGSSVATKTEESAVTEERIAHILHEASAALRAQQVDDSGSDESKPPSQTQTPSPGPKVEPICSSAAANATSTSSATTTTTTPTSSSSHNNNNNNSSSSNMFLQQQQQQQQQQRRGRKPDHDDISQEQVLRIYHDELAKMMSGGSPAGFNPAAFNPAHLSGLSALAGGGAGSRTVASNLRDYNHRSYTSALFERSPEEIRMALDVYQQELNRLMQPPTSSSSSSNANVTTTTATTTTTSTTTGNFTSTPVGSAGSQHQSTTSTTTGQQQHVSNGFPQDLSLPKSATGAGSVRSDEESSERDASKMRSTVSISNKSSSFLLNSSENGERSKSVTGETGNNNLSHMSKSAENSIGLFMPHSLHNILRPSSSLSPDESNTATTAPTGSGGPSSGVTGAGGVASPLQRIASITNSLMSQPANPTLPQVTQRPMKAILPPITQQQFDTYQNLNTEDIVKKVKEQLSQYSISQRLFGESVLGLSQGSVSDLLARPKPWHMLTQKGREPFIRMKIFLEDENAVHKLVASQYKIAPEKLMRTGGYSGSPQSAALKNSVAKMMTPTSMPATSPAMSSGNSTGGMDLSPNSLAHSALALHGLRGPAGAMLTHGTGLDLNSSMSGRSSPIPSGLTYGATLAHFMSAQSSLNQRSLASQMAQQHQHQQQQHQQQLHQSPVLVKSDKNSSSSISKSLSNTPLGGHNNNATSNGLTPSPMDDRLTHTPGLTGSGIPTLAAYSLPAHSVYELAALTQDLDTQGMTTKIKEVLLANNIGQKIFGEAVLGLSQGSVSELLSKPKPWHMLSIKGREPFIRMQLWLSDPRNIEHIQRLKTERREAGKRRRDLGFPMGNTDAAGPNSNASSNTNSFMGGDNSSNDGSMGGSPSPYGGNPNHHHQPTSLTTTGAGASLSSSSPSPAKKQRILFSDQQKEALKLAFSLDPYPSTSAMEFLAQELNLSTRTITNWFHNHRMRLKQQQSNSLDCSTKEEISSSASPAAMANGGRESSGQFDPIHFRLLFHQRLFEMQVASGEEGSGAGHHHNTTSGSGGGHHPGAGAGGMTLPASLAGLPPQLAGNLNMMASLGMPYPFYATGMLSQFCMGLGNPSPDMAPGTEGLDLTLARQRVAALGQSDSDAEDSDCESDTSSRTGPTTHRDLDRRRDSRPPVKMPSPLMSMIASAKTAASLGITSQEGPAAQAAARSSRRSRKPAAPQWVNPHWQQNSAVRDRVESEDGGRDSSEERDKKKTKHFHSVDANLNNFVEKDPSTFGGRDSSAERPSVRTVDDDDDDKYDNDDEEDDEEEMSPKRLNHRRAGSISPSRRASPSPSPSSDEDKMDDESEAKDDDNNEQS